PEIALLFLRGNSEGFPYIIRSAKFDPNPGAKNVKVIFRKPLVFEIDLRQGFNLLLKGKRSL
ncbi:MAG: hypothetical protein ACC630_03585, partial [Nitrospinota bacterium]